MEIFTWFVSAVSLAGVWLNIKKLRVCFVFWMFSNASWMFIDYAKGIYAQASLNLIYACLAVWGLIEWSRDRKASDTNAPEVR